MCKYISYQDVLKHEKNNYLAWVLSAVSLQELGQEGEALSAFCKATELQPEQLTAWQGLAAFLEKERSKSVISTDNLKRHKEISDQLVSVYQKLSILLSRWANLEIKLFQLKHFLIFFAILEIL